MKKLIIHIKNHYRDFLIPKEQIDKAREIVKRFNEGDRDIEVITNSDYFIKGINIAILAYQHKGEDKYKIEKLDYSYVEAFEDGQKIEVTEAGIDCMEINRIIDMQNEMSEYYLFN